MLEGLRGKGMNDRKIFPENAVHCWLPEPIFNYFLQQTCFFRFKINFVFQKLRLQKKIKTKNTKKRISPKIDQKTHPQTHYLYKIRVFLTIIFFSVYKNHKK